MYDTIESTCTTWWKRLVSDSFLEDTIQGLYDLIRILSLLCHPKGVRFAQHGVTYPIAPYLATINQTLMSWVAVLNDRLVLMADKFHSYLKAMPGGSLHVIYYVQEMLAKHS